MTLNRLSIKQSQHPNRPSAQRQITFPEFPSATVRKHAKSNSRDALGGWLSLARERNTCRRQDSGAEDAIPLKPCPDMRAECVPGTNLCVGRGSSEDRGCGRIENGDNCRQAARNTGVQRHARLHMFELNANVNARR